MEKKFFVGNNKAAYSTAGIIAGEARKALEKGEYNNETANTVLKAIAVQMRVNEIEVKIANSKIKVDEHNRKYRSDIAVRSVESTSFDSVME